MRTLSREAQAAARSAGPDEPATGYFGEYMVINPAGTNVYECLTERKRWRIEYSMRDGRRYVVKDSGLRKKTIAGQPAVASSTFIALASHLDAAVGEWVAHPLPRLKGATRHGQEVVRDGWRFRKSALPGQFAGWQRVS